MTYNTEKKKRIEKLFSENPERAFSASEICLAVTDEGEGKSTVYRIISNMVLEGTLKKLTDSRTRHVSYRLMGTGCSEHLHLMCKGCGRLIHLDSRTSHVLERRIMSSMNFALEEGAVLTGRCESCLAEAKNP